MRKEDWSFTIAGADKIPKLWQKKINSPRKLTCRFWKMFTILWRISLWVPFEPASNMEWSFTRCSLASSFDHCSRKANVVFLPHHMTNVHEWWSSQKREKIGNCRQHTVNRHFPGWIMHPSNEHGDFFLVTVFLPEAIWLAVTRSCLLKKTVVFKPFENRLLSLRFRMTHIHQVLSFLQVEFSLANQIFYPKPNLKYWEQKWCRRHLHTQETPFTMYHFYCNRAGGCLMGLNYQQSFDISIAMYCITWIYPLTREQSCLK